MKVLNCKIMILLHTNKKITIYQNLCYKTIRNVGSLIQNEKRANAATKIVQWRHVWTAISASCFILSILARAVQSPILFSFLLMKLHLHLSKTMEYSRHKQILQLLRQDKYEQVNRQMSKFWKRNLCFWEQLIVYFYKICNPHSKVDVLGSFLVSFGQCDW